MERTNIEYVGYTEGKGYEYKISTYHTLPEEITVNLITDIIGICFEISNQYDTVYCQNEMELIAILSQYNNCGSLSQALNRIS